MYFCCLEALQNVAKHTSGAIATVRLSKTAGWLDFSVNDNGHGFDMARVSGGTGLQNMTDRLAVLGGSLTVDSATGQGTTVKGRLPVAHVPAGDLARQSARTQYLPNAVR